ncbi:hypothetical protein FISHEDRAFT_60686 [Fistulina hepatica ATCC 64428]|uniref:Uncharacterized protein n=1 Tax=Fistulina hepatica ATCC 64428 TaxID=1128425 RepID=A0A0D7A5A9_9AGAR|nr:hypothetical protein FISHEDRAFT_60686 [Fistulina hepatica ATCC 64428]
MSLLPCFPSIPAQTTVAAPPGVKARSSTSEGSRSLDEPFLGREGLSRLLSGHCQESPQRRCPSPLNDLPRTSRALRSGSPAVEAWWPQPWPQSKTKTPSLHEQPPNCVLRPASSREQRWRAKCLAPCQRDSWAKPPESAAPLGRSRRPAPSRTSANGWNDLNPPKGSQAKLDSPPSSNNPLLPAFSPRNTRIIKKARGPSGQLSTGLEVVQSDDESEYDLPSSPTPVGPASAKRKASFMTTIVPEAATAAPQMQAAMDTSDQASSQALVDFPEPMYDAPIRLPFPADREDLPKYAHLNPHKLDTSGLIGPAVDFVGCEMPSNEGPWPLSTIRGTQLMANLATVQERMLKVDPHKCIALVPLGGGNTFYKSEVGVRFPKAAEEACVAIAKTIGEDHTAIRAFAPIPKASSPKAPPYAYPLATILEGATPTTIDFLLTRQTWAFAKDLAFIALPFEANRQPWFIATLTGSAVRGEEDDEARFEALAAIKEALWTNADFSRVVCRVTASRPGWANLSPLQRMVRVTDTYEILRSEATLTENTTPIAHYQLHGRPITEDEDLMKLYVNTIRKATKDLFVGFASLTSTFLFYPCRICREPTHPKIDCPLPRTHLWYGPLRADMPEEPDDLAFNVAIAAGARVLEEPGYGNKGNKCRRNTENPVRKGKGKQRAL